MTLRIGTFNVRLGIADDGDHAWDFRKELLASRIQEANPDLLGVQEAYDFQMDFLAHTLPDHVPIGLGREDGKREGEYAGVFARKSKLEVLDSGTFWLSETPEVPGSMSWETVCPRVCTWAWLRTDAGEIRVYNTHLDHASAWARQEGVRLILRKIAGKRGPAIFIGDFNATYEQPPIQAILADEFVDVLAGCKTGTWHNFTGKAIERIDFVFTTSDFRTIRAWVDSRSGANGLYPSDHFPVWADLELPVLRRNS